MQIVGDEVVGNQSEHPDPVVIDPSDTATGSPMQVRKRDGSLEPVDLNKIVRAVARCAEGLDDVDPMRVATRTICGLYDGATTEELDDLSIRTAAALIARGARLLPAGRPPARHRDRQGGPEPGHLLLLPVGRGRPRAGDHR